MISSSFSNAVMILLSRMDISSMRLASLSMIASSSVRFGDSVSSIMRSARFMA